jgi:hypothetical protein
MFSHISIERDRFAAILKYMISDAFRAADPAFRLFGTKSYFEGFRVWDVRIGLSSHSRDFGVNIGGPNNSVVPAGLAPISFRPLRASVDLDILLTTEPDVIAAGFNPPSTSTLPLREIGFLLFLHVDPAGDVSLRFEPEYLPEEAEGLRSSLTVERRLPFGAAFAVTVGTGALVLNAGIHLASDSNVVMRAELQDPPDVAMPLHTRRLEWARFFQAGQPSQLATHQWCIDAPTFGLRALVQREATDKMKNSKSFEFTRTPWVTWQWDQPGMVLSTEGLVPHACAGNDLRVKLWIHMRLSAPQRNIVRLSVRIDYEKDAGDTAKCILLITALWPILGLITFFDNKVPWWAWSAYFVLIAVPFLIPPLFGLAQITGFEEKIVGSVVSDEVMKAGKGEHLVQVSDYEYYLDRPVPSLDGPMRDWAAIDEIAATSDHLLLRGAILTPEPVMPRLRGVLEQGFGPWDYVDRCQSSVSFETSALVRLELSGDIAPKPNVTLKGTEPQIYGLWPMPYQLHGDLRGYYNSVFARIEYTGIPGQFVIRLRASLLDPYGFMREPYPLQLRLITTGGARHFTIPPPPPRVELLPLTIEEIRRRQMEEIAWKMANCYRAGHLFGLIKVLQIYWLPRPPDTRPADRFAQRWIVRVEGLAPAEEVRAWDTGDAPEFLAAVRADREGVVIVRLTIPHERWLESLMLTRGDTAPIRAEEYGVALGRLETPADTGPNRVTVAQTLLERENTLDFAEAVDRVDLIEEHGVARLATVSARGVISTWRGSLGHGWSNGGLRDLDAVNRVGAVRRITASPSQPNDAATAGSWYVEISADRHSAMIYRTLTTCGGGVRT